MPLHSSFTIKYHSLIHQFLLLIQFWFISCSLWPFYRFFVNKRDMKDWTTTEFINFCRSSKSSSASTRQMYMWVQICLSSVVYRFTFLYARINFINKLSVVVNIFIRLYFLPKITIHLFVSPMYKLCKDGKKRIVFSHFWFWN